VSRFSHNGGKTEAIFHVLSLELTFFFRVMKTALNVWQISPKAAAIHDRKLAKIAAPPDLTETQPCSDDFLSPCSIAHCLEFVIQ